MRSLVPLLAGLALLVANCGDVANAQEVQASSPVSWGTSGFPILGSNGQVLDICFNLDAGGSFVSDPIPKTSNSGTSFVVRVSDAPSFDGGICADGGSHCSACSGTCEVSTASNVTCQLQVSEGEPAGPVWADAGTAASCAVTSTSDTSGFCAFSASAVYYPEERLYCPIALDFSDGGTLCARVFLQGN